MPTKKMKITLKEFVGVVIFSTLLISGLYYLTFGADHRQFERTFGVQWPHGQEDLDIIQPAVEKVLSQKREALSRFDMKMSEFKAVMETLPRETKEQNDAYAELRHQYTAMEAERKKFDEDFYAAGTSANDAGYSEDFLRKFDLRPREGGFF